jgi:hypothetical protein
MLSRSCIASIVAAILLLLGPAVARANHGFSVSATEAHAGDEIEFQIAGTQAGESYIVKVEDQEVASGVDNVGNGITDKFNMPDFGNADKAVLVEVDVTPLGGDPDHRGFQTIQYLAPSSGTTGTPTPLPAPIKTVADPPPVNDPIASSPPPTSDKKSTDKGTKKTTGTKQKTNTTTGTGGNTDTTTDTTPATTPATQTSTSSSVVDDSSTAAGGPDSPGLADDIKDAAPPGPTGPTAPVGGSIAAALSPLSGFATPGKTGFPILLIVLFVLLAALALTATGPRIWQRYEPALPWGPDADDEIRLTALGRASASSAELQQTIAAKKKSRSVGRSFAGTRIGNKIGTGSNGSASNGAPSNGAASNGSPSNGSASNGSASNGAGDHSKTPAAH